MLAHFKVMGRVQGIGFRYWVKKQGTHVGLSGWVRNRISGAVEVYAVGEKAELDLFLSLCRRGSPLSRVDKIEPVPHPDAPLPPTEEGLFLIQPTV